MPLYYFHSTVGLSPEDTVSFNLLVNERLKVTYYQLISSTSGTITPPAGSTIKLDQFGSGVDAILSTVDASNNPTFQTPHNGSGVPMGVTLDGSGNYTADPFLESTVALIYCYTIDLPHFDETKSVLQVERDNYATEALTYTNKTINVSQNSIVATANRAARFNTSTGLLEASLVTNAEQGYLSGVTSAIQTQLNAKEASLGNPGVDGYVLSSTAAGVRSWIAGSPLTTKGDLYGFSTIGAKLAVGTNGQMLFADSSAATGLAWNTLNITTPGVIFTSPITYTASTRTFALALATQTANIVFAGPTTGSAATPTFRSLVSADIPSLSATYLTVANPAYTGSLTIGTLGYSDTGILASFQASANSYEQIILRNTNAGVAASADYIVSNDSGTASTFYGDFGINSSAFTGSGSLNLANATYLTATNGDLVLGTTTSNSIRFVINGGATDALTINGSGIISTGTWNATIIDPTYGGTGINNGTKTITLSGNLTTTGAFNPTFSIPRSTTWTLPNTATETLAGLGTAQTFTAKQTFTAATTEIASLTLLDTTYKIALDVSGAGVVRVGNGFTSVLTNVPWSFNTTSITLGNNCNIAFGTAANSNIGATSAQKFAFWGATAIVQPINSVAIDTLLTNTGLRASGGTANFATAVSTTAATISATNSNNGDSSITVTNANAGAAARSFVNASNGTYSFSMQNYGTSYTTAGILQANLAAIIASNTVGMAFVNSASSTKMWWAIGGTAAANEVMRMTSTGLSIGTLADATSWLTLPAATATKPSFNLVSSAGTLPTSGQASGDISWDGTRVNVYSSTNNSVAWVSDLGGQILATVTGINAKSTGTTTLYTVPAGKTVIITGAIVRCTAATSITNGPTLGIGIAAGEDDIFTSTNLAALIVATGAGSVFGFSTVGMSRNGAATNVIKVGIDTAATGTSQTIAIDLIGYLL